MIVKSMDHIRKHNLLGGVILHSVTYSDHPELSVEYLRDNCSDNDGFELDIVMTINGVEVNIEDYFERIEKDLDRNIKHKALDVIKDKFCDISDMLEDLQDRVVEQVTERLEDWETIEDYK